jgi:hypothetical protein
MTLAIDFNGVLCNRQNVPQGKKLGEPMEGAKEAMDYLSRGNKLYIFTDMASTSNGWRAVEEWLKFYGMPWGFITDVKPKGMNLLIDDRAIRFVDWKQTLDDILRYGSDSGSKLSSGLDRW